MPAPDSRRAAQNRARQKNGSYRFLDLETAGWLAQLQTTARCAFCPDLVFEGTAEECCEWGRAHRLAAHPGVRSVSEKQRKAAARTAR